MSSMVVGQCQLCGQVFHAGHTCPLPTPIPRKASYIGAPACFALEQAARQICEAFNVSGCYVVGSSLHKQDWRDVDVRLIMSDDKFAKEFPDAGVHWEHDTRWLLFIVSISAWLSSKPACSLISRFSRRRTPINGTQGRATPSVFALAKHPMKMTETYLYVQSTGQLYRPNGSLLAVGYSGHDRGRNIPEMQDQRDVGPIPCGLYTLGEVGNSKGPLTIRLIPDPLNEMHGRSGFLLHGDNKAANHTASEGCIIVGPIQRGELAKAQGQRLRVIARPVAEVQT